MKFYPETLQFSGHCCGAKYLDHPNSEKGLENPGVFLNFKEPFPDREGYESVTVETEWGNLYFEFSNTPPKGDDLETYNYREVPYTLPVNDWCHHFYLHERFQTLYNSVTKSYDWFLRLQATFNGIGILITSIAYKPVFSSVLKEQLIYESGPFFNMIHGERKTPSLCLAVYKGT